MNDGHLDAPQRPHVLQQPHEVVALRRARCAPAAACRAARSMRSVGAITVASPEITVWPSWFAQGAVQHHAVRRFVARGDLTAIVSVSPTRIGALERQRLAARTPCPGRAAACRARRRSSAAPHMPCAITPWYRVDAANSRIDVLRVDVARHRREQLDVGGGQRALDAGAIADRDLVEGAVADDLEVGAGKWCWSQWCSRLMDVRRGCEIRRRRSGRRR